MKRTPRLLDVLATSLAAAWALGLSAAFTAEVLAFPDLPHPSTGQLAHALAGAGWQLLPIAAPIAVLLGVSIARGPALYGWAASTFLAAGALLPGPIVLFAGDRLGKAGALGGLALALLATFAFGLLARRRRTVRLSVTALLALGPLWLPTAGMLFRAPAKPGAPLASAEGRRVVLLGLDGATWDIITPMIRRNELPTLARLVREGASGTLTSLEPTLSNRVWTSAATGVVPERHGITDFFFDRRFIRVPTIWDLVDRENGRVGLFEYLVTDPPLPFHGFVLPGWMAYNPTKTYPPDLTERLRVAASLRHPWQVAAYFATRNRVDPRHAQRMMLEAKLVASAFLFLYDRHEPDLAACIFYGTDRLGHRAWRYFEPEAFTEPLPPDGAAFRETLPNYYREADRQLGRIVSALDDGRTVFVVMSDHGMGPMEHVEVTAYTRGLRVLERLGLTKEWYVENPHSEMFLNCKLPGRTENATVDPSDQRRTVDEAAARFAEVRVAPTGEPVFHVEVGDLTTADLKITIPHAETLEPDTELRYRDASFRAEDILQLVELSGNHRTGGIVILDGPGVSAGTTIRGAVITDIGPTILWVLGLAVARDLDGHVLEAAFSDAFRNTHAIRLVPTFGTIETPAVSPQAPTEELLEKLRGLGYIN